VRSVYLVCYDISNDKRLRRVYRAMRGLGDHLQLSVFRCELSPRERAEMVASLSELINNDEDQVLIVDVGPADGRASTVFEALGRPYRAPVRHAVIV
jgi:CRISPR-associated protein Cas2